MITGNPTSAEQTEPALRAALPDRSPREMPAEPNAARNTEPGQKLGKPRGRPVKFDADAQRQFCALIRIGCPRGAAARLAGVSRSIVLKATRRDPQVAAAIDDAERHCQTGALRRIARAGKTNWRAAAWLLEWQAGRRGRRGKIRISPSNNPAAQPSGLLSNILGERIEEIEAERTRRLGEALGRAREKRDAG